MNWFGLTQNVVVARIAHAAVGGRVRAEDAEHFVEAGAFMGRGARSPR